MGKNIFVITMEMEIARNVTEIEEEIRLHGHIEWRSKKNLDEFARVHTFEKDFCIVGYATAKTMRKWGLKLMNETFTSGKDHDVYLALRKGEKNRIYYLFGLGPPTYNFIF